MTTHELTVRDLIAAMENIRRWAASVRAALEAGDKGAVVARLGDLEITNEHLVATQRITENWAQTVRLALESLEDPDSLRFSTRGTQLEPCLTPLGKKPACAISPSPPIAGDQCGLDVRVWLRDFIESH